MGKRGNKYRNDSEYTTIKKLENTLSTYKERYTKEKAKDDPDASKVGIWEAKIQYYEKQIREVPARLEKASLSDPKTYKYKKEEKNVVFQSMGKQWLKQR